MLLDDGKIEIEPPVAEVDEASSEIPEAGAVSPETLMVVPTRVIEPPFVVFDDAFIDPIAAEPVLANSTTDPGLAPAVEVEVLIL